MIQVGATIKELHLFMGMSPRAGEMIIGKAAGRVISGTAAKYLTRKFRKTGEAGKETNIGRNKIIGVSRV